MTLLSRVANGRMGSLMGHGASGGIDRTQVRLAELVGALSLGIDLGFGQPMEHVLRQCMIALRLAEGIGLDEEQRAVVYYTALLINVGCHSDAHEQAKWFGDDIALKSIKYDHEPQEPADGRHGDAFLGPGTRRSTDSDSGLAFALSGHREVDEMIAHHAAIARTHGGGLPPRTRSSRPRRRVRTLGRPRAGRASSRAKRSRLPPASSCRSPSSSRYRPAWAGWAAAKQLARERRGGRLRTGARRPA